MTIPLPSPAESICSSLEWSRKMLTAGWVQGASFFVNSTTSDGFSNHSCHERLKEGHRNWKSPFYIEWDAPTFEEVARKLPQFLNINDEYCCLGIIQVELSTKWRVDMHSMEFKGGKNMEDFKFVDLSLSNAACAMYCYLAEHNLLPTP